MEQAPSPGAVTNVASNTAGSAEQSAAHADAELNEGMPPREIKQRICVSCFGSMPSATLTRQASGLEMTTPLQLTAVPAFKRARRETVELRLSPIHATLSFAPSMIAFGITGVGEVVADLIVEFMGNGNSLTQTGPLTMSHLGQVLMVYSMRLCVEPLLPRLQTRILAST